MSPFAWFFDLIVSQQAGAVARPGAEVIGVRPAVIDAVLRQCVGEVIQTIQARRFHDWWRRFRRRWPPAGAGELVHAHGVDAELGETRGRIFALFLLRRGEAVGKIGAPEFDPGLVAELEVVAHHPHAAVLAGRFVQPVLKTDHAGLDVARGGDREPVLVRQHFGKPVDIRLLCQQARRAGQVKGDGDRFLPGLELVRGQLDAEIAVIGDRQGRVDRRRERADRLGTEDQCARSRAGRRDRRSTRGVGPRCHRDVSSRMSPSWNFSSNPMAAISMVRGTSLSAESS